MRERKKREGVVGHESRNKMLNKVLAICYDIHVHAVSSLIRIWGGVVPVV